jgi:nucleotide-binding universal stress UspA family protein
VDRYVQETLLHHTQELESLLGRAQTAIPKNRLHLIKGEPETVISWFCKEKKVDVLVLGTIARTGLGAALIGNTAETLVSKVECSILAVKPDGFVCPVQTKS